MMEKNGEKRGPLAWMAGNSVAANLLMIVLLVGGLIWALQIKQEVFPDFDPDHVNITVAYPGRVLKRLSRRLFLPLRRPFPAWRVLERLLPAREKAQALYR